VGSNLETRALGALVKMVDFPYEIVPLWQWIVIVIVCGSVLALFIALIQLMHDNDYILVMFLAALCVTFMLFIGLVQVMNANDPRVHQYHVERREHQQYVTRLRMAQQAIAKEDTAARQLRLEQKMKEL